MSKDQPRNVRNFWINGNVDGVATPIATGPASADGGFKLEVLMRDEGKIASEKVIITGVVENGQLFVRAYPESQMGLGFEVGTVR